MTYKRVEVCRKTCFLRLFVSWEETVCMAAKIKPAVPPGVGAHSKANRALIHPADNERITTNNIALRVILGGYKFEFVMGLRKKKKKPIPLDEK